MRLVGTSKFIFIQIVTTITVLAVILSGGCRRGGEPRLHAGAFFGSPAGIQFPDPNHLGTHSYEYGTNEINGMVYTCKGGFIDLGHLREAADRTAYLKKISCRNLIAQKTSFSFYVIEPSQYYVNLCYPLDWNQYSKQDQESILEEVSLRMGQYLAHLSLIWHEILTGYGFATAGIFSGTISSFSCEDTYSDLLGIRLGSKALQDTQLKYDDAMTKLISEALKELDVQSPQIAYQAAKTVEGQWYTGGLYFFVTVKKHNFDVGLDDGYISPVLVDGICPDTASQSYPAPNPESLQQYGFTIDVKIEPLVFEKDRIYDSIHLDHRSRIDPKIHFKPIIEYLEYKLNKAASQNTAEK